GLFLDKAKVLDSQPMNPAQHPGSLARDPARADDQGKGLVVAIAAQMANAGPAQASSRQDKTGGQKQKKQDGAAGLVGIVHQEDGGHHQQRQQAGAFEDTHHLFAESPQAVNLILASQLVSHAGQEQDEGQLAQAQIKLGAWLIQGQPARSEAQEVSANP